MPNIIMDNQLTQQLTRCPRCNARLKSSRIAYTDVVKQTCRCGWADLRKARSTGEVLQFKERS